MNEQMMAATMIVGGLLLLIFGGEILVRGASAIATAFKIPPLVIGLTVVAFGTSAPELGVSLQAAFAGVADVAVGNVVGSNIFAILFILGLSALVSPLSVSSQLIRLEIPLLVGASILTWSLSRDGLISRIDAGVLFSILLTYLFFCLRIARRESKAVRAEFAEANPDAPKVGAGLLLQFGLILAGLACLGLGSRWLVSGSVEVATWMGVSELVIGLTIVAIGTSMPEVVTSVVASMRGERGIAVGNVIGSNLFNLLCVLGLSGLVAPAGIPVSGQAIAYDMPIMILVAVACLVMFITGRRVTRLEGVVLLIGFLAYNVSLLMGAK